MAYDYGIPDAGSVLGQTPSYGSAAASLMPAPPGAAAASGDQPSGIVFLDGFGYRRRKGVDANGNPIYTDLTADDRRMNAGQYSWDREDAELNRRRSAAAQQELRQQEAARLARESAERNRQYGLQTTQLQQQGQQIQGVLQQIQQQGAAQTAQIELSRDTLTANTRSRDADRAQQADQFDATQRQQLLALQQADRTANRRLDIEDSHFSQQLAADKSARKLQAIMGISQSLAQLRI